MRHLSTAAFADAIEGRLSEADRRHLDGCARCAATVASLSQAMRGIREDDEQPEPSPLFWEHFPARVRDAVQESVPDTRSSWRPPAWAVVCSIVIVAAALVVGLRDLRLSPAAVAPGVASLQTAPATMPEDPAWTLLTDVASAAVEDDPQTAPVTVRPSEVDRAVTSLSDTEREELRRLLQNEMKRPGD
jgi:hypothetical protein